MQLRPARPEDAGAIRRIYNHGVTTDVNVLDVEPRSLQEQQRWLRERSGVHAVIVAELDGEVAGFASLSRFRDKQCYATSVEDSVYVDHRYHGRGVGRALLAEIIQVAADHGFHTVIARVAATNEASVALHASLGFAQVGVEREIGRKFGRWLDVLEMQLLLT